jgi:mevalonate kinase
MRRSGKGRAHGKVILLGEHAVVYGVPAIAAGLAQGVSAMAVPGPAGRAHLCAPSWGIEARAKGESAIDRAFRAILEYLHWGDAGVEVVIEPEIPAGAGLGASAAMAVATARALADLAGRRLPDEEASAAAFLSEKVIHGNPSGLDNAIAAYGGVRYFQRGVSLEPLAVATPFSLVVGHSGEPGSTRETVAAVAALHKGRTAETEEHFREIAALVESARDAIELWDLETLGECMTEAHAHLQWLGVSTFALDRMVDAALEAGALGAKLTGGGGGGCAIALAPGKESSVEAAWAKAGFTTFVAELGRRSLPVVSG